MSALPRCSAATQTVAERVATWLRSIGVRYVFGVSGGGVAPLWQALSVTEGLTLVHTQHESGATFAATEASLASGTPVAVFTTTGPGLTNALTGAIAARQEGAHVLLLSGVTAADRRHRGATQETGPSSCLATLYTAGPIFDEAAVVESPTMLPALMRRIEEGMARPAGFVAHLGIPTDLQSTPTATLASASVRHAHAAPAAATVRRIANELHEARVAIVAGFHARHAQPALISLAERLNAPVVVTPRGHGCFPARHPLFRGVIGFAGHSASEEAMRAYRPSVVLAVGTGLGEGASQWCSSLAPSRSLILVHPSPAPLTGACEAPVVERITAPVQTVLAQLNDHIGPRSGSPPPGRAAPPPPSSTVTERVDPAALLDAVQEVVVRSSDALVMAEAGNAFAWAIHRLRFEQPRLRVSVGWGSMGHFTTGVIGAALTGRRAVALVGDGAMLMMNELGTAARHGLDATWIVLNDSCLGMCRQGTRSSGLFGVDTELAEVDFAAYAASMGVRSWTVQTGSELHEVLAQAIRGSGPRLVDVRIDRSVAAPIERRIAALTWPNEPGVAP